MKKRWIAALALTGLLLTTGAYAESTPEAAAAPVQAETTAEPQHNLTVTTKYRYFISQYRYIRERKVSYFDNVYAYNHGEYSLTPFDSTVPEEYFVTDEGGTLAIAPIVLDITDAMRERLYGADVGETALYYGQYCERKKDRKGVWGYTGIHEGIDFVASRGYMIGMGGAKFQPNTEMSRAMLVTVLYRIAGEPAVKGTAPFRDVEKNSWYTNAVIWAYQNNVTNGVSATEFAPEENVTREQMVAFFARYAKLAGVDTTAKGDLKAFADASSVSAYAVPAMTWAVEAGLIKGVGENKLDPTGNSTRGQVATVIVRYATLVQH